MSACSCCGRDYPEDELDRLRSHSDVAVCGSCLSGLLARAAEGDLIRVAPVLPVEEMAESIAFWTAAGFEIAVYDDGFASAYRDGVELHLVDGQEGRDQGAAYIHAGDVDGLHAAWKAAGLDPSPVRDEPWGMREFTVVDAGHNRVRVGRNI